jgi:hypothetical protein
MNMTSTKYLVGWDVRFDVGSFLRKLGRILDEYIINMKSFYDLVMAFTYPDMDDIKPHWSMLKAFEYDLKNYKRIHRREHKDAKMMRQVIDKLYEIEFNEYYLKSR